MEQHSHQPVKKWVALGIVLAIVLPYLSLLLLPLIRIFGFDTSAPGVRMTSLLVSRVLLWLIPVILFFYARKVERGKLFPWDEKQYSIGMYIAFFLLTFVALIISLAVVSYAMKYAGLYSESDRWHQLREQLGNNIGIAIFTCITAAVVEESVFRGYLLPRLWLLLKGRTPAIIISSVLFGLLHFGYGTLLNVIGPFVIGLIFAIHYSYFRNLKFLIFFHFAWDVMAIFLALRQAPSP